MTKRITPLIDDPAEPEYVRELIGAGREDVVADYDYDKGFSALVAGIEAGVPMPDWAQHLDVATSTATTGTQAAMGGAAAVSTSAVGWVVGSVVAAGLVAVSIFSGEPAPEAGPTLAPDAPLVAAPAVDHASPTDSPARLPAVAAGPERAAAAANAGNAANDAVHRSEKRQLAANRAMRPDAPATVATTAKRVPQKPEADVDLDSLMSEKVGAKTARSTSTVRPERGEEAAAVESAPSELPAAVLAPSKPQYDEARLEREMRMLKVAESLLTKNPARALSMARQGEKEFTGSMFAPERQQVLLLALVELGRVDEARRLAKPYLSKYPRGPFSDRVRRALATGSVGR